VDWYSVQGAAKKYSTIISAKQTKFPIRDCVIIIRREGEGFKIMQRRRTTQFHTLREGGNM